METASSTNRADTWSLSADSAEFSRRGRGQKGPGAAANDVGERFPPLRFVALLIEWAAAGKSSQ